MNPIRTLFAIVSTFVLGALVATATGLDPITTGGTLAAARASVSAAFYAFDLSLPAGMALASVIDVSDLVTEYNAYYNLAPDAAERRRRLKDSLYNTKGRFDSYFLEVETDSTREDWTYSENSEVLQPYQTAFTPKGNLTIKPNPAVLFWAKYDISHVPDHLVLTYHSWLRGNKLSVDECPFVEYVIMNHIIPRGHQDWKTKVSFKGVYAAPSAGTAGAAETTANGVRKVLRDMNTAGMVTPTAMGALPTDPVEVYQYIDQMVYDAIPEQYRDADITFMMAEEVFRLAADGLGEKHNKFYERTKETGDVLRVFSKQNIKFAGFSEMEGSTMIFGTLKDNAMKLNKGSVKKEIMKVETLKRELFLFTDFHSGYHFADPTQIFMNNQDLS